MSWDAGPLSEFAQGRFTIVEAGGHQVGVYRDGDRIYALRNVCPHMGGPVCAGEVLGRIEAREGRVGDLEVDPTHPVIACAWHSWEFDIASGRSLYGDGLRVRTFRAEVRGGRVWIDVPGTVPARHGR